MTRRKPVKRWRRTGNEEDPNKRPRRTAQLSSLPAATNVHVETDQQYLGGSSRGTQQGGGASWRSPKCCTSRGTRPTSRCPCRMYHTHSGTSSLSRPASTRKRGTRECFNC
ncbi:hypothetical protein SKAU_G00129330 [Synaphobranchus kaupii]|uniref:Uncharacterized protein n=1 Tax=Synaphobranchus kaupii TaxID=118154 RepID=A0A9Q1FQ79_SYNKA|nr:hypothetical protein SKAU_G00129330 [Synaphobranchus kaupii]